MAAKHKAPACSIDLTAAGEVMESFTRVTDITCRLYDAKGGLLLQQQAREGGCALCRELYAATGVDTGCAKVHQYGARQAERFGGRYIYFCPADMAYFASPVTIGGQVAGALVGGPVLIMDPEDYLEETPLLVQRGGKLERGLLKAALETFRQVTPDKLKHLSALLFALTVYLGDNSVSLVRSRAQSEQQQSIAAIIQSYKEEEAAAPYPYEKEKHLVQSIAEGDEFSARALLNELLGYVIFSTGRDFLKVRARSLELLVMLSRAAIQGGAEVGQVLELNDRAFQQIDRMRSVDDLVYWLADMTGQYAALVFDLVGIKHKDTLYKAIEYMKRNYMRRLPLEETARHVGLTPSYFSKIFSEEIGAPYNHYLNKIRVEQSRSLLLSSDLSMVEISALCGFEDQSYFTKVFKRFTGITPSKCRDRRERLELGKEREI